MTSIQEDTPSHDSQVTDQPGDQVSASDSRFVISIAQSPEELEMVYRFRYRIYVEELGKETPAVDHQRKTVRDEMDNESATILYVSAGGEIVATMRWNQGGLAPVSEFWRTSYRLDRFREFSPSAIGFTSRLMIAPSWRGSRLLGSLLIALYRLGRERGACFDFCNCAPALIELYEQLGYRRYTDGFTDPGVGYRIPLVLVLDDHQYLRTVRSPFIRAASRWPHSSGGREWLEKEFDLSGGNVCCRHVDVDLFWSILEEKLHKAPIEGIPLLQGLSLEDARRFLNSGTILNCKQGTSIIRRGDIGDEMFVILSGSLEVFGVDGTVRRSLAVFGPGQFFGEIAFLSRCPRTADVIALTDVELLVLTQSFLRRAMKLLPEITAVVLFNLSLELCGRLRISTNNLVDARR